MQESLSLISANLNDKAVVKRYTKRAKNIQSEDCVTCMATLKCNTIPDDLSTRVLIGTESQQLLLLNEHEIEKRWELNASPSIIRTSGFLSGNSILAVACRDRFLRLISNLSSHILRVSCESLPVDITIAGVYIFVALMSKSIRVFDTASTLVGSFSFDFHIVSLASVELTDRQLSLCCVALSDGSVYFLNREKIYSQFVFEKNLANLIFGKIGREPFNLLTITSEVGLSLRSLSRLPPRKVKEVKEEVTNPIPVPRLTKFSVDQSNSEIANAESIYDSFMNSMRYLHMLTITTYLDIIKESALSPIEDIHFSCTVAGMGPTFVLDVQTTNTGIKCLLDVILITKFPCTLR